MSAITGQVSERYLEAATQTLSMDELCKEYLRDHQSKNDRLVEELKPLCEEIPSDAIDPVTMEPIDRCMVLRCGHSLNITTIVSLAKANGLCQQDAMECPMCKVKTPLKQTYTCYSLDHCSGNFQRINKVFKSHV